MGLKSGLLAGQSKTSGKVSSRNFLAIRLVCFGSLSCWNFHRLPSILPISEYVDVISQHKILHSFVKLRAFKFYMYRGQFFLLHTVFRCIEHTSIIITFFLFIKCLLCSVSLRGFLALPCVLSDQDSFP